MGPEQSIHSGAIPRLTGHGKLSKFTTLGRQTSATGEEFTYRANKT